MLQIDRRLWLPESQTLPGRQSVIVPLLVAWKGPKIPPVDQEKARIVPVDVNVNEPDALRNFPVPPVTDSVTVRVKDNVVLLRYPLPAAAPTAVEYSWPWL